jgi:hypothetical protein
MSRVILAELASQSWAAPGAFSAATTMALRSRSSVIMPQSSTTPSLTCIIERRVLGDRQRIRRHDLADLAAMGAGIFVGQPARPDEVLPAVRDQQVVGIVSRANLVHALASVAPARA